MTTPPATPTPLHDDDFDAAIAADALPVLVDFHADWCPPCRALAPHVERLARSHAGHVRVATVDIDSSPQLVERFGIRSVPTFVLLRGDDELDRFGAVGPTELVTRVERHL